MDDFDRRSAVLLCQRNAGTGRLRLLRSRDVRRSRSDLLCAGPRAVVLRPGEQLQQLLQAQVPPDQVLQAQVLQAQVPSLELLQRGPDLLRSRADLRRSRADLRRADLRRSGCRQLLQLV